MARSVLDAIKQGIWDFEPEAVEERRFAATRAMPGTEEKLEVLAARLQAGLPLWHGADRTDYDDVERERTPRRDERSSRSAGDGNAKSPRPPKRAVEH